MLMMKWGKDQSTTKETQQNTIRYNRKQKEWKSKYTGDNSESCGKKRTFQNFNNGYFLFSQLKKKDF